MVTYLLRKLIYSALVLFGVITLIFFIFNVLPGDPARLMMGQRADEQSLRIIRQDLGLNKPIPLQFLKYLNDLSPISVHTTRHESNYFYLHDVYEPYFKLIHAKNVVLVLKAPYLRRSYQSRAEVSEIIAETLPNTFVLALAAILFATIVGILVGLLAGIKKDTFFDRASLFFSVLGMSLPSFFAAILMGWIFAYLLGNYTGLNLTGNLYVIDDFGEGSHLQLKNLILPALTLGIRPLAIVIQLTRNSFLDVMTMDYIRTARAAGLSKRRIVLKYALKNSLNPVVTAISGWFASMLAGVIFIEYIFGWKGLGFVIVNALNSYDLPVVLGCVLTISLIFVVITVLVDIVYSMLDPRIRFS